MNNFDNLTVKDYAHASRLYVAGDMRLAPKFKHLYHVVFNVNSQAKLQSPLLSGVDASEVNILAKSVELPRYNLQTASLNQYNRKKIVQTGVQYVPINLEFHDDNAGLTSLFWKHILDITILIAVILHEMRLALLMQQQKLIKRSQMDLTEVTATARHKILDTD
jgi:hypothetical protein